MDDGLIPKVLINVGGAYIPGRWDGVNRSGIQPLCDKVLVLCDDAAEKIGSLITTDNTQEKTGLSATTGVMVALGPLAFRFSSDRTMRWEGETPAAGARVFYQRYAGHEYTGLDGKLYRLMEDRCIAGKEIPAPVEYAESSNLITGAGVTMAETSEVV